MIKNLRGSLAVRALAVLGGAALAVSACERKQAHPGAFQGVVELDERRLGFEAAGRVEQILVQRGSEVQAGELLARLDDSVEQTAREGREAEAEAARARVALLRAGSRPEEIRAAEAQVRAAEANEALLRDNLARERALADAGAVPRAVIDDLAARLRVATAEREALVQRLRALRSGAREQEIRGAEAQSNAVDKAVSLESERVRRRELLAALAGTVLDVHVDPGEVVGAGTPVVTLADTSHPYTDVFVPQGQIDGIAVGSPAKLFVDSVAQPFEGRVENVARRTEFTPRFLFSDRERPNLVVRVRVRIDDPTKRLHAGVPAFALIERSSPGARAAPAGPSTVSVTP